MNLHQIKSKISILLFILCITTLINSCCNCGKANSSKKVITGEFSWEQWQQQAEWKTYEPANYTVAPDFIDILKSRISSEDYEFLLFAGSWCSDSESEMPKIMNLFGLLETSSEKYTIYGVDRDKREPSGIAEKYNIEKVPTLVILKNGEESGRVIEFPEISWEEDIMQKL